MQKRLLGIFFATFIAGAVFGILATGLYQQLKVSADTINPDVSQDCAQAWNYMVKTYPGFPMFTIIYEGNDAFNNDMQWLLSICSEDEMEKFLMKFNGLMTSIHI